MWGALAGFLGRLFGSDKAADTIIEKTSKAIDAIVYTDQEKAEDFAKSRTEARGMLIAWLQATQGQNLARRLLAMLIAAVWLVQYLGSWALSIVSIWSTDPDRIRQAATITGDYASSMTGAMMLILGFYFAAPHLGTIVDGAMGLFSKRAGK
jgi:hypothetical protein